MCFLFSFIPATVWVTVAYFVLFSSAKAEGSVRAYGRVLSIWLCVVAAAILMCGAYVSLSGLCPLEKLIELVKQPGA